MNKINKITKAEQMSIGQMYMFLTYGGLKRGICKKLSVKSVVFDTNSCYDEDIYFIKTYYPQKEYSYIAEYNSRVFHKYQKLMKQQEEERNKVLNGEFVCIDEIINEKTSKRWWNHFYKKNTKKMLT